MDENAYVRKDVFEAKIDTLLVLNDKTNERIDDLKDSVNRNFAVLGISFAAVQIGLAVVIYFLSKL